MVGDILNYNATCLITGPAGLGTATEVGQAGGPVVPGGTMEEEVEGQTIMGTVP